MDEPLAHATIRTLARNILQTGEVNFIPHAAQRLKKHNLTAEDCLNVLRGGWCEFEELVDDEWRYRMITQKICVVITFESETELTVVTAWRFK